MTDSSKKEVRVRYAPSPTGPFHLGGARTALFNWLFVKNQRGRFILRIEDTDVGRSTPEYEKNTIDALKWLGLTWDEGPDIGGNYSPYRQSDRLQIYEKYLSQLLQKKLAYWCFCSREQLESDRQAMLAQGLAPKYSGRCRALPEGEAEGRIKKGEPAVIRFRMPETEVDFNDIIRGRVKFDAGLIGDFIIAKGIRESLYNFSVVIDDQLMEITHIIRGEEHLSNTPKQILIQRALSFNEVRYAHLPLILAPDRSKLSKRNIEISVADYRKQGYLPEAIFNFLALLGWHPKDEREVMSKEELIAGFDLKRVQRAGAVFSIEKLEWLNSEYIRKMSPVDLAKRLRDFVPDKWSKNKEFLANVVAVERERIKKLADFKELADFFFDLPPYEKGLLFWPRPVLRGAPEVGDAEKTRNNLKISKDEIAKIPPGDFSRLGLEKRIMPLTEVWGRGELLWPLRVAVSGKAASPGLFEIMETLGKKESLKRIDVAINKL